MARRKASAADRAIRGLVAHGRISKPNQRRRREVTYGRITLVSAHNNRLTVEVTDGRGQSVIPPHLQGLRGFLFMSMGRNVSWRLSPGIYRVRAYSRVPGGDLWEKRYTVRVRNGGEAEVTIR